MEITARPVVLMSLMMLFGSTCVMPQKACAKTIDEVDEEDRRRSSGAFSVLFRENGKEPETPEELLRVLSSGTIASDEAFRRLVALGKNAIPALLSGIEKSTHEEYGGVIQVNPMSSVVQFKNPSVAIIRLYIVDAILANNLRPHLGAWLISDPSKSEEIQLQKAISAYRKWWEKHKDESLDDLRHSWQTDYPLVGSSVDWY